MKAWEESKQWSDRFMRQIKQTLGEHLIEIGNIEQDRKEAGDLTVLKSNLVRIGCRIRKHHHLKKYHDQFTIRQSRASGVQTEMDKIRAGWGNWFFYGFEDSTSQRVIHWFIADLNVFREHLLVNPQLLENRGGIPDGCGTTFFSFYRSDFPITLFKAWGDKYVPPPPVPSFK